MSLGYFIMLESKETSKCHRVNIRHRSNLKRALSGLRWDNFNIKRNNECILGLWVEIG